MKGRRYAIPPAILFYLQASLGSLISWKSRKRLVFQHLFFFVWL